MKARPQSERVERPPPEAELPIPPCLRSHPDGVTLAVRLQPRAARTELGAMTDSELRIKVTAPPVEAAANEALLRFLAEVLDCPRRTVQLIRGQTARSKVVRIQGLPIHLIAQRLAAGGRRP